LIGLLRSRAASTRRSFNKDFLLALATDFKRHRAQAIAKVRKEQPAAYMKICALLVPKELKVETTGRIEQLTDEQLDTFQPANSRRFFGRKHLVFVGAQYLAGPGA
jgi:hypothetical protein